jgi:3-dehydroquinate dehydratase
MSKISKKDFFQYMSALYEEKYKDNEAYEILVDIIKRADDAKFLNKIKELAEMNTKEKLQYRYAMAVQGKEFTPTQIDQYISLIKYALKHIDT